MPNDLIKGSNNNKKSSGKNLLNVSTQNKFAASSIDFIDKDRSLNSFITSLKPLQSDFLNSQSVEPSTDILQGVPNLNSLNFEQSASEVFDTDLTGVFSEDTTVKKKSLDLNFQSNFLDDFDNYTYNFKLYVAPEEALKDNSRLPTQDTRIIAQSGVTTQFSIQDVEFESIVGPSDETKNTIAMNFTISIIEPGGISLIDNILKAGSELGIKNILDMPFMLELSFKGFDENGSPIEIRNLKRTWRLRWQDIQTTMDEGGSRYLLSFVNSMDYGFHRFSSASIFKEQISYSVDTVGNFFKDLAFKLNVQEEKASQFGDLTKNEYAFVVNPEMKDWVIGELPSKKNTPSNFVEDNGKIEVVINKGDQIQKIVDTVISLTKEGEQAINPNGTINKLKKTKTSRKIARMPQITCEVEYGHFNAKNNEYALKFTYYINLFEVPRALPDRPDSSESEQKERLKQLSKDSLRKKYSYIFTGENTDILSLDLDFNMLWRHATAYYTDSMFRRESNSANFNAKQDQTIREIKSADDLRDRTAPSAFGTDNAISDRDRNFAARLRNLSSTRAAPDSLRKLSNLSNLIGNLPAIESVFGSGTSVDDIFGNPNNLSEVDISFDGLSSTAVFEGERSVGKNPALSFLNTSRSELVRNLPIGNRISQQDALNREPLIEESTSVLNTEPVLQAFKKQSDPALDITHVNENFEKGIEYGRGIFGVITNQLYSSGTSDLLQIEMEIKGDPYWLGETDQERIKRLRNNNSDGLSSGNFVNYLRGESSFLLNFKTPAQYNEDTGFPELRESTAFLGVYNLRLITNTFSEGLFTQRMTAQRDLNTSAAILKKVLK